MDYDDYEIKYELGSLTEWFHLSCIFRLTNDIQHVDVYKNNIKLNNFEIVNEPEFRKKFFTKNIPSKYDYELSIGGEKCTSFFKCYNSSFIGTISDICIYNFPFTKENLNNFIYKKQPLHNNNNLEIGNIEDNMSNINDISIFNKSLSEGEIKRIFCKK